MAYISYYYLNLKQIFFACFIIISNIFHLYGLFLVHILTNKPTTLRQNFLLLSQAHTHRHIHTYTGILFIVMSHAVNLLVMMIYTFLKTQTTPCIRSVEQRTTAVKKKMKWSQCFKKTRNIVYHTAAKKQIAK